MISFFYVKRHAVHCQHKMYIYNNRMNLFIKRLFSTITVFVIGVIITYFLSERFNHVTDKRKLDFSKGESETLFNEIGL